ncbi:MAG: tRNA pseudouridine(13) synthase TruD [Candidatus Obscuribacter sp.]|nr:tRNA pseudouridine(13) synthase TruD [Candidatus Obscuribacter sp.]
METAISIRAARNGFGFVSMEALRNYAGNHSVVPAQHKADPTHFRVEEWHRYGQLTVSTASDFTPDQLERFSGRLVAATLVKSRLTSAAAIRKLAKDLGVPAHLITMAGNKDRTAVTAQMIVINAPWLTIDDVRRHSEPDERNLRDVGYFIKDIRRHNRPLRKGFLEGNCFTLKTLHPGMSRDALETYLEPRLESIRRDVQGTPTVVMPNFFGRQRLGRRQNLLGVGLDFITMGSEAGVKRFCCEVVEENDHHLATELRRKLAVLWASAEKSAEEKGQSVAEQTWDFMEMLKLLDEPEPGFRRGRRRRPSYEPANMFIEHKLISKLCETRNIETAFQLMRDDVSLWVGAYQGYWFNQALAMVLSGQIPESALEQDRRTGEPVIPLYFAGDVASVQWYEKWLPEAIPSRIDPVVCKHFLTNTDGSPGPRRPSHVPVGNLKLDAHDESITLRFSLRRGSYATTFLSLLFNLDNKDWEEVDK